LGTAYTPGLAVSRYFLVRKTRKLPLKGKVLVKVGDSVEPNTIVARAELPGNLAQVKVANILGLNPKEMMEKMLVKIGDKVAKDQEIARNQFFFNLFKTAVKSSADGHIEYISDVSGNMGIREAPIPIDLRAYIKGKIVEVLPEEGVVVETKGAFIQGIFGIDGEREGTLMIMPDPERNIEPNDIKPEMKGKIIVARRRVSGEALKKAVTAGVSGVVVGGVIEKEIIDLLGYEIGVAITGQENVGVTLVITEGFGEIRMSDKTFNLLKQMNGKQASINGTTQIRAGVIRPEVIVPLPETGEEPETPQKMSQSELTQGTRIRIIREPNFGMLATVTDLPPELTTIESGAKVRILRAKLDSGEAIAVPRANVEII
jgi:hypothetical protein